MREWSQRLLAMESGLHPSWDGTWLLVPVVSQAVEDTWTSVGVMAEISRSIPGAVSLSTGLCVLVYRAAEKAPAEEGAGFLGMLSPVQSSGLAKQGQARDHPGSVGHGWREATCCAAWPKRECEESNS